MKKLLLLAALIMLPGCSEQNRSVANFDQPFVRYQIDGYYVREFALSDGTRCVMVAQQAVTCDFKRPLILVPQPQ